jgi:hypothetical protein
MAELHGSSLCRDTGAPVADETWPYSGHQIVPRRLAPAASALLLSIRKGLL